MCWLADCFTDQQQSELHLSGFLLSFRISNRKASGGNLKFIIGVAQIRTSHTRLRIYECFRSDAETPMETLLIVCMPFGQLVI